MSAEKRQFLIDTGVLNPDGSRKPYVPPVTEPSDAVAEAEAVVVTTEQEG